MLYDGDTRRYEDTKRLFEYGFTQIESITPESLYAEDPRVIDITGFDTSDAQHGELTLGIRAVDDTKDMTIVGRKDNIDFLRENFGQVSSDPLDARVPRPDQRRRCDGHSDLLFRKQGHRRI